MLPILVVYYVCVEVVFAITFCVLRYALIKALQLPGKVRVMAL
jgi:hypothetical protein